jgi:hypothetical protein
MDDSLPIQPGRVTLWWSFWFARFRALFLPLLRAEIVAAMLPNLATEVLAEALALGWRRAELRPVMP